MEKEIIQEYIKAGEIAKKVKVYARQIIEPGRSLFEIASLIDAKIEELGAVPAFPVGLSIDEIAAHYTPIPGDTYVAKGLLCVDIGVAVDGYIADTAFTLDLTPDKKHSKHVELNKNIQEEVCKMVKPGIKVKDVGNTVINYLESYNKKNKSEFRIIKSLSGHTLDKNIVHAGITIPNILNGNETELKDTAFAVEPFVTTGAGDVYEGDDGGILILRKDLPVREKESREVLKFIKENYGTRPFCERWIAAKTNFKKLKFTLKSLERSGIIYHYPLLIEKSKAPVSQFENTFLISDEEFFITTKED